MRRSALLIGMILLAAAGFVVSLFVHLSTYTDMQLVRHGGWLTWMHFLFVPPFIVLVHVLQKDGKIRRARFIPDDPGQRLDSGDADRESEGPAPENGEAAGRGEPPPYYKMRGRFETSTIFPYGLPQWAVVLVKVIALNLLVQVFFFAFLFPRTPVAGGTLERGYRVKDKEGFHDVTEDEYFALKNREMRGYSGIWLIVYLVPALALASFVAGKKREEDMGAQSPFGASEDLRG